MISHFKFLKVFQLLYSSRVSLEWTRFAIPSEEQREKFIEDQTNKNTLRKTVSDVNALRN